MSNRLTCCEAARQSGIGLHDLMKAIRSGGLAASKCQQYGFVVTTRDLDRCIAAHVRGAPTRTNLKPLHPVPCAKLSSGSIKTVRTAFGPVPPPAPRPPEPEPAVRPARDLSDWCESYLDDLREVDWHLRRLEADVRWLDEKLNGR